MNDIISALRHELHTIHKELTTIGKTTDTLVQQTGRTDKEVATIRKTTDTLVEQTGTLNTAVETIKRDTKKIRKDLETAIGFLDTNTVYVTRRMDRVERHLSLPPLAQ